MVSPNTQEVYQIADFFHNMANAFGNYIQSNKAVLSANERNELYDKQNLLLQASGEVNMIGTAMVLEDVKESLDQLENITTGLNKAIKKALQVQDIINIASTIVQIGTAIISKNPKDVVQKSTESFNQIKRLVNNT